MTDRKRSHSQPDRGEQGSSMSSRPDDEMDQGGGTHSTRDGAESADDRGMDPERRNVSSREGDPLDGEIMDDADADDDLGGTGRTNR